MSNFQRTRSKVWWGDSPPNIGSPIAQASGWNNRQQREEDWEPQVPRWAPNRANLEDIEESPPLPPINAWLRRQSSPGSHKSQDSGFSDSDSSPPNMQNPKEKPEAKEPATPEKKCCQAQEADSSTPKRNLNIAAMNYLQTPKLNGYTDTPVRSLIKTPKDVQEYLQAHCDIGHKSFESVTCESSKKLVFTPGKTLNDKPNDKCDAKKSLLNKFNAYDADKDEVDACTEKSSSTNNDNIEYIRLSASQQIAVNNQPRMRSPITRISYHVPVHYYKTTAQSEGADKNFQRNGLNRSFDYGCMKLDEQILDEGPHSLSYIEVMHQSDKFNEDIKARMISHRKITDSLNLKTPKKYTSKTKQKIQSKNRMKQTPRPTKGFFNFLPKRNDSSFKTIYDITRSSEEIDRVPSLGLPSYADDLNVTMIENSPTKDSSTKPRGILKSPGSYKISPPLQFQDSYSENKNTPNDSEADEIHFCDFETNVCTSTPKLTSASKTKTSQSAGKIRPVNLLTTFNTSLNNESERNNNQILKTPLEKISNGQPAHVKHFLCELIGSYEPECMTTLQSKSIGVEMNAKIENSSATITSNIRKVQTHGQIIAYEYNQLIRNIEMADLSISKQCLDEINSLIANINEFVFTHSITLKIKPPGESPERWDKIKLALQNNIQRVTEIVDDVKIELNETNPEIDVIQRHLKTLLDIFVETARAILIQQMKTLVSMLEEPPSDMILKSTLTSLSHLGALMTPDVNDDSFDGESIKFITSLPFIECGVPRALLSVIIESNKSSIKALSLRAIATICVSSEAVQQIDEAGGLEILSDILNDQSNPEPQMREAVTVLTQITAPWLEGDYRIQNLNNYLETIVKNLTELLSITSCCQLLLLCVACLVNLVNMVKRNERQQLKSDDFKRSEIIDILSRYKTMERLLESVKQRGPNISVFLQEQTATLINIVTTSSKGQILLAGCPATAVALVCFLRTPCASPARPARLQAEFRLINQATEALARLCTLPDITAQVIQLEGVPRLIRMVQTQKTHKMDGKCSDQILVNCLRALRLIVKNHEDIIDNIECDISDMIEPSLIESVKIYSAKQESYV